MILFKDLSIVVIHPPFPLPIIIYTFFAFNLIYIIILNVRLIMNIFVIVIELYVNFKNNFQNWIKLNIIYFT